MKNISISILLLAFFFCASAAQAQVDTLKPQAKDQAFVLSLSGIINSIAVPAFQNPIGEPMLLHRYYINNKLVYRTGVSINSYNLSKSSVDSIGASQLSVDSSFKQVNLAVLPAIEYHFQGAKRLDPYVGAQLGFVALGTQKERVFIANEDTTGKATTEITFDQKGGYMLGANLFTGFNFFIYNKLSIGLEYHFGLWYQSVGGDFTRVTIDTPVSGSQITKREIGSSRQFCTNMNFSNQALLHISYYFNRNK